MDEWPRFFQKNVPKCTFFKKTGEGAFSKKSDAHPEAKIFFEKLRSNFEKRDLS
jgi:hypothetical protein